MKNNNTLSKKKDNELAALLIDGSLCAFEELYIRYKAPLIYYCKQFLKDETASKDIVQDIFLQIWERRSSLTQVTSFSGYLHTLAQNRILNIFRQFDVHTRFAQHVLMNETEYTNDTENSIIDNDYAKLLNEAIESLSARQKQIFQLSRIQGLTYKEISELLQISLNTVQEHASLAIKKIKEYLKQHTDINFQAIIPILILFS